MTVMKSPQLPAFLPLTGLYEPSAIQQLPDGRFLVVEDEKEHPFSLVSIAADGGVDSEPLSPGACEANEAGWKLDDLEGLAIDRAGRAYALTSHSRDGDGEQKKSRDKLVRFRIDGRRVLAPVLVTGLRPALLAAHPALQQAAAILDVKSAGGLNIEALEITPDQSRLLLGFRGPLLDRRAIICSIDNLDELFDHQAPPRIGPALITLDLDGAGIRGMSHVPALDGYLVIGGPVSRQPLDCRLWFWSGAADAPARAVTLAGGQGVGHAEGVCPALIGGEQRIVIVSDDGDRSAGSCARFLLLDPETLRIAP
jgi:hypothetical protein